jgi:hypothetical protein
MLTADETRVQFTRRITNRFNESSLSGAGAVSNEVSGKDACIQCTCTRHA